MNDKTMLETGMQTRREVLGAVHVDRSLARASEFARPMQELVTEYCWGAAWSRPGLGRRVRSLLNIATLTALGRSHELSLHVRGAVTNGVTPDEIRREALLQAAIYCGVPAAMDAQRTAMAALAADAASGAAGAGGAAQSAGTGASGTAGTDGNGKLA